MNYGEGILITRTDRIGDVILSLPVIKTLKKVFPERPIYFMVSSYVAPLLENYPGIEAVIKYDVSDGSTQVSRTKQLTQQLRDLNIKTALMLVYDADVLSIIKNAGIKERLGPLTKIYGIFYYTKWHVQHRSRVDNHELEYNLGLLKLLGVKEDEFDTTLELPVSKGAVSSAFDKLKSIGFENPYSGYIIVHVGCGGSALNWRYSYYAELASRLFEATGLPIILTGTDKENTVTSSVKQHIRGKCFNTAGLFSLKELVAVISEARLFIGPSTGPTHIAGAVSVPLVTIFPPIKVQSARRWGPYSKDAIVITPRVECPAKLKCLGEKCEQYNCMDAVSIDDVFEKAKKLYDDSMHQMGLFEGASL